MVGDAALPSGADLGIELVDEVDDVEEAAAGAVADAGAGDGGAVLREEVDHNALHQLEWFGSATGGGHHYHRDIGGAGLVPPM